MPSPVSSCGHAQPHAVQALGARQRDLARESRSEVASQGSLADHVASSSAASVTSRVSGPAWSSEEANAIMP